MHSLATVALMLSASAVFPVPAHAQDQRAARFMDDILQSLQEFKRADGKGLTRAGREIAVDLAGLDTALRTLSFAGEYEVADLRRKHGSIRMASYRAVAACRTESYGERCEFPVGVQTVRFFEPKRLGRDSVSFLMGVYERNPANSKFYPGTGGVVFDVVVTRNTAGWRISSARVRATG